MTPIGLRRRIALAALAVGVSMTILGGRLVDLQVFRAHELQKLADNEREQTVTLYGNRGNVVSDNGTVLATTVYTYTAVANPSAAAEAGSAALKLATDRIGAITGQGGPAVLALFENSLKQNPASKYVFIKSGMDVEMFTKLDALPYTWMTFTKQQSRTYPNGAVAGSLLGYIASSGNGGLEGSENSCLAGSNGLETYQRGVDGIPIPGTSVVEKQAKDGGTLHLTINSDLEWSVSQILAEQVQATHSQFGFVTVAEAKTGKIKAVAQYPNVDPNNLSATDPTWWALHPLTATYEPGSVFKALTAAMLIDQGKATPTSQVVAPFEWKSGQGADIKDAWVHSPLDLTLTGVLMLSSNTGISQLGTRLSDETRYDYMKKFGIGESLGIPYPGESDGILTNYRTWDDQTKYATTFGQGVSATQLQMVDAYQALANNGVRIPLTVVDGCTQADGKVTDVPKPKSVRVVSATAANTTLDMLESVVTGGELSKQIQIPGYRIAAKTGTAQEPNGSGGYTSLFYVSLMGVVPVEDPQYVVAVNLGFPTTVTSSAATATLFHDVMSDVLKTFRVAPSNSTPSNYPPYY